MYGLSLTCWIFYGFQVDIQWKANVSILVAIHPEAKTTSAKTSELILPQE